MDEIYGTDSTGAGGNSQTRFKTSHPRIIIGDPDTQFYGPEFTFKLNTANGFLEPTGVESAEISNVSESNSYFFNAEYLDFASLSKSTVLQYFSEEEDFVVNLFDNSKGLNEEEKKTHLFLLVVANVNDPDIGSSCLLDMNRAVKTFTDICSNMGISIFSRTLFGAEYNKTNIQSAISDLKPGPNDIVVFYYSGHGFRKPGVNRRFPFIDLRATPKDNYMIQSMNMEDIYRTIRQKGARLNLVLSDCCNTLPESVNSSGSPISQLKGSGLNYSFNNLRSLFLDPSPKSILATAADTTQKASSNNNFGGFFSYFFTANIQAYCTGVKNTVNWDLLLQDTRVQTIYKAQHTYCDKPYVPQNICQQYPFYIIDFGK